MSAPRRPSVLLFLAWGGALAAASGAVGMLTVFGSMFLRPHAFGGRDGQGAAGLAALGLLVSLVVGVAALALCLALAVRLRSRQVGWALPVTGALVGLAAVAGLALGLLG